MLVCCVMWCVVVLCECVSVLRCVDVLVCVVVCVVLCVVCVEVVVVC